VQHEYSQSHRNCCFSLLASVREVVAKEFKQTPDTIVLAFSLSE
jgi:hypothetical protein